MQSSAGRISKFLPSGQEYQHDQQNTLQNQAQVVLISLDQTQGSDYLVSDHFHHLKSDLLQHDMLEQDKMIGDDLQ